MTTCPRCGRTYDDGVRFCPVDGNLVTMMVDPHLGKVLMGQFHLVALAGRGAMGTVYRAQQANMDRTVAVKVLRRDLLKDQVAVKRFLREARAAARLSHPNIVTVHLVGEMDDGVPFIVMEYIEGGSLGGLCDGEGPLPPRRALHLARQIASALGEAHGHGIIHRDLKPENILLAARVPRFPPSEDELVKVLDFGIAKLVHGEGNEVSQLTREGTIFGTPHYISPEQAGGHDVDARADLYSLGVILFLMVTGRLPFEGTSGMQVLMRHLRDRPPRPRDLRPDLPLALDGLILRAIEKEPGDRFQDAARFIEAMDSVEGSLEDDAARTLMGVAMPKPIADEASRGHRSRSVSHPPHPLVAPAAAEPPPDDGPTAVEGMPAAGTDDEDEDAAWRTEGEVQAPFDVVDTEPVVAPDATAELLPPARRVGAGPLVAAAVGAALLVGGGVALWRHRSARAPAKTVVVVQRARPDLGVVEWLGEQVVLSGPFAVRMGFGRALTVGEPTPVRILIVDGQGPVVGARVEMVIRGHGGRDEALPLRGEADAYLATARFSGAGRQRLRISVEPPDRRPFHAVFEVEVLAASRVAEAEAAADPGLATPDSSSARPSGVAPGELPRESRPAASTATSSGRRERSSSVESRAGDHGESLPVTVLPARPAPISIRPRALGPAPGSMAPTPPTRSAPAPARDSVRPEESAPVSGHGDDTPATNASESDPYRLLDSHR